MDKSIPYFVLLIALTAAVVHAAMNFGAMPATMAVHFDSAGAPDGFASKGTYYWIAAATLAGSVLIFWVLPAAFCKFRVKSVSLPNRAYWSRPENLDRFYSYFGRMMAWFGVVQIAFLAFVNALVFSANLSADRNLNSGYLIAALVAYFAFVIIWLVSFFWKLSRP